MKLNEISRKFRIAVVLSAIWLVGTYVFVVEFDWPAIEWLLQHGLATHDPSWDLRVVLFLSSRFILFGVLPLLVLWGAIWMCAPSNRK